MTTEPPKVQFETGADEETDASNAQHAAEQAKEKAQDAAAQAQERAQEAAGQAQDKLHQQINERSAQIAEQANSQASDLRSVSESLRNEGKDGPADTADRLAGYAEKVGGYLDGKDSHQLLADAEDFGRERPWAAAAGGLAIGFAASRFLKASSHRRYHAASAQPDRSSTTEVAADSRSLPQPATPSYSVPPAAEDASDRPGFGTGS